LTKAEVFELGIASVTLNGDAYLVRNESQVSNVSVPGARLGTFVGGVPGTELPISPRQNPETQLTLSGKRIRVPDGSLLTFRLDQPVRLVGSH
jgi:hypothetical protein